MAQPELPEPGENREWLRWVRVAALLTSAGLLVVVFRQLRFASLVDAVRTMHKSWFLAAVLVYGALFIPASFRWHLLLKLNQTANSLWTTARVCLIGHLFYVLLFGAIGGDAARSALYAHWYRKPLAAVLATAPLDRLLGFLGLLLFGLSAVVIAFAKGGSAQAGAIAWKWQAAWLVGILVAGFWLWWVARRAQPSSFLHRFSEALVVGGKGLVRTPKIAFAGVICGVLVQVTLSATLALNLQAVCHSPLPWSQMIWVFPLIALLGTLPITVAGLGAREGAALLFLGIYGISGATAVAASLLTLAASLFWALIGAAILLWETRKRAAGCQRTVLEVARRSNA